MYQIHPLSIKISHTEKLPRRSQNRRKHMYPLSVIYWKRGVSILYISCWGFLHAWLSGEESTCNVGDMGLIPGSGRSSGEGNSNPLQYSCLENPMDRGAWWATVNGGNKRVRHDLEAKQQHIYHVMHWKHRGEWRRQTSFQWERL